jgi:crotonobetainyl-CoA:carnitine CoA-transferase CaiB-like acyl-CoA transferase
MEPHLMKTSEISSEPEGPLTGYRVLELGSTVAGPFCGRLLADFGAEVIKVEPPKGDAVRSMGKRLDGRSLYAASILRNKALVSIDLNTEGGRELVREMVADCDVLVENFKPGSMERWGLGYDVLAQINPGLVMVRISGFGQDGPYANRPGYGVIAEAMSGLRHLTGDPDRPPSRMATSLTDYITGLYAAFGVTLALLERKVSGRGQMIDAALYESAFSFMEPWIPAFEKLGHIAERSGSVLPGSTPNNLYPTGDGDHIHIAAPGDSVFGRLVGAMGRPDLAADPRFASAIDRSRNHQEIDGLIANWTSSRTIPAIERTLVEHQVPVSPIYTIADLFQDAHVQDRGAIVNAPDMELGSIAMAGVVPRLSGTPGRILFAGGQVGSNTREVLEDTFGIESGRVDSLIQAGAIFEREESK